VQRIGGRCRSERTGAHAEDHVDALRGQLDALHDRPDDLAAQLPVSVSEAVPHLGGELVEAPDEEHKVLARRGGVGVLLRVRLEHGDALAQPPEPGLELRLQDQALRVAVDEPGEPLAQLGQLGRRGPPVRLRLRARRPQRVPAPRVLPLHPRGVLQQSPDLGPDRRVQCLQPHRRIGAHSLATEAVGVRTGAAVVAAGAFLPGTGPVDRAHAREGVAATAADEQALEQIAGTGDALAGSVLVLPELLLHGVEERGVDERRDGQREPLLGRDRLHGDGASRLRALAALRTQAPRLPRAGAGAPVGRLALVGGVLEHVPDGGAVPARLPRAGGDAQRGQAPGRPAEGEAVAPDPLKHLAHHAGLIEDHLVPRRVRSLLLAGVAIAIRGVGQDAQRPEAGGVPPAPAAALHDLRPFVLGDDALDLHQQFVFRRPRPRPVEEGDGDAGAGELVEQEHLMGVPAGQAVGPVDVEHIDAPDGHHVAQALQSRAHQGRAAVAVVHELQRRGDDQTVRGGPLAQGGQLAADGLGLRLAVCRDPRIERGLRHEHRRPSCRRGPNVAAPLRSAAAAWPTARLVTGTKRA
jgi:hypothetical protein